MPLPEEKRLEYERLYLDNKPQLTGADVRSAQAVLSFGAGGIKGEESIVVKFQTEEGVQTLALNPVGACHLGLLLLKGVKQNDWFDVDFQSLGPPPIN